MVLDGVRQKNDLAFILRYKGIVSALAKLPTGLDELVEDHGAEKVAPLIEFVKCEKAQNP